ncbi:hypothetical protein Tco_0504596 [Tanacetum coccineum]
MGCCLTSWFSKKQTALAISTTEAEYVSAGKAYQQALWMKQALVDYGISLDDIPIMCDNKGAIDLSKDPVQHSCTKRIEIRYHFLRDNVQKGNISIEKMNPQRALKKKELLIVDDPGTRLTQGKGPNWLFDLDYLTDSMNYQHVRSKNQANKTADPEEANHSAGTQDNIDAGNLEMEAESAQDYFKSKRQKTDADREEEDQLKAYLKIVPDEEGIIDYESASTTESLDLMEVLEDELWQNQERWNFKSWDFYENCGVHTLILEDGTEIHMLAERNKELASPKQTALGKDNSNPLIVDSLLKTIWLSMHLVIAMKH